MATERKIERGPGGGGAAVPPNFRDNAITKGFYIDHDFPSWTKFKRAFATVPECLVATDGDLRKRAIGSKLVPDVGNPIVPFENALIRLLEMARAVHRSGGTVFFCGNGGSAAMCSHMAVDWTKNGGIRSRALHDPAVLTCFGNDYGYEQVFVKQLEAYATDRDMAVVISSSGNSPNVLATGRWCVDNKIKFVTLSGMDHDNALRLMGSINFYVPCEDYGIVELAHTFLLHSIVSVKW